LLVAGKAMAQTFLANSATRLHPIEWASGVAAGVAAADMARHRSTSRQLLERIDELQEKIAAQTPIEWTLQRAKS
jgi:ATP-dependent protease ClpP protease subunit